jgi:hypothetical protein
MSDIQRKSGRDLIDLGVPSSPRIGEWLKQAYDA